MIVLVSSLVQALVEGGASRTIIRLALAVPSTSLSTAVASPNAVRVVVGPPAKPSGEVTEVVENPLEDVVVTLPSRRQRSSSSFTAPLTRIRSSAAAIPVSTLSVDTAWMVGSKP